MGVSTYIFQFKYSSLASSLVQPLPTVLTCLPCSPRRQWNGETTQSMANGSWLNPGPDPFAYIPPHSLLTTHYSLLTTHYIPGSLQSLYLSIYRYIPRYCTVRTEWLSGEQAKVLCQGGAGRQAGRQEASARESFCYKMM